MSYLLILLAVLVTAFHSGSETGLYAINRLRLRLRAAERRPGAALLSWLTAHPQFAITSMLVGTNVGVYAATVLCTEKLRSLGFERHADLYSTLLMAPVLLVLAEIIPKVLYQRRADTLLYKSWWLLALSSIVFAPITFFFRVLSGLPGFLSGRTAPNWTTTFTPDRLRFLLSEGAADGALSTYQRTMAENILKLKSGRLTEVMTPLAETVMIPRATPLDALSSLIKSHRYSRVPVFDGERSNVVGTMNVLDLVAASGHERTVEAIARQAHYLDADISVAQALYSLQESRQQMGVIRDQQGRTIGIVTLKDLVEEIVGELAAW